MAQRLYTTAAFLLTLIGVASAADADRATQVRGAQRAAFDAGFPDLDAAAGARRDESAVAVRVPRG